jgi:hypothetical protein
MIFWWRRCIAQSRSPRQITLPLWSACTWNSMSRGFSRKFSM